MPFNHLLKDNEKEERVNYLWQEDLDYQQGFRSFWELW